MNNFYSPLRTLFEGAVSSGFIKPENLSLVRIIDLPGDGNTDGSRAAEWGPAAVDALRQWALPVSSFGGTSVATSFSLDTSIILSRLPVSPGLEQTSTMTLTRPVPLCLPVSFELTPDWRRLRLQVGRRQGIRPEPQGERIDDALLTLVCCPWLLFTSFARTD